MQINRLEISVRYLIILVGGTANIDNIPESVVIISISRISNTIHCLLRVDITQSYQQQAPFSKVT